MSIAFVKFWASVLTLVMSTFEKIVAQENLLDLARDFRFFKGNKIDIEENNITVITCNCPTLNFHFILKNGYVKRYISSSTTHECYTYEIGSTSEKMQVVHNGEVVATAEDSLEIMILKCSSKHASWKILRTCWEGFESHPCRIDCRHQHGGNGGNAGTAHTNNLYVNLIDLNTLHRTCNIGHFDNTGDVLLVLQTRKAM
ncbi:uncharacterized protein LOC135138139 isoform X3 [Zophobas morio]|uniref:uncharacterized protein LOC135138139 isoform X3 n=1 Tax=Zophobas morio TaxID=2755281 RepID=UPI003083613E